MSDKVVVTVSDGVRRVTINRADRRNAIDPESIQLLLDAVRGADADDTRVVVLTGAGDAFCAGADLQGSGPGDFEKKDVTKSLRDGVNPLVLAMRSLGKPIIGRVHGHAVGVGCNIALACDLLIASDKALFSEIFVRIGLMPDGGGTYFLPRLVGYQKAFELMATGDIIDAGEALRLGLVNRVVPYAELDSAVDELAGRLAKGPAISLARIKEGLNRALQSTLAEALEFEAVNQGECFRSADFVEGVAAFLQKRKAVFTGK